MFIITVTQLPIQKESQIRIRQLCGVKDSIHDRTHVTTFFEADIGNFRIEMFYVVFINPPPSDFQVYFEQK